MSNKVFMETVVNFTLLADITASDAVQFIYSPKNTDDIHHLSDMVADHMDGERHGVDDMRFYNCDTFVTGHDYILVYDYSTCTFTVFDITTLGKYFASEVKFIKGCVESMKKGDLEG